MGNAAADQRLKLTYFDDDFTREHRHLRILARVEGCDFCCIEGIRVIIISIGLAEWLIVPNFVADDKVMTDIGPFPTPEVAWATLQLIKD